MTSVAGEEAAPRLLIGWAAVALAWAAAALWLARHAPAISSDDALFLARGLTRFSLLDDSPQFPGYPGFIAMGRLLLPLAGSPLAALALLSGVVALALPPAAALVARRSAEPRVALPVFALGLAMPLLPALALGLLTDGAGLLFTLLFLAQLPHAGVPGRADRMTLAGATLGWAAVCRPSDAVLILAAAGGALAVQPGRSAGGWLAAGFALVVLPTAAVLLVLEPLYLSEGLRFVRGHAFLWGNTPFSDVQGGRTWQSDLLAQPLLALLLLLPLPAVVQTLAHPRRAGPATTGAAAAFIGHAAWVGLFQNPDNLRHLAPLLTLGPLLLCLSTARLTRACAILCLAAEIAALGLSVTIVPSVRPPLAAAAAALADLPPGEVVATNTGVATLRQKLPLLRVYDSYYAADAALGLKLAPHGGRQLTSTRPPDPIAMFPARFLGERTLWLVPAAD